MTRCSILHFRSNRGQLYAVLCLVSAITGGRAQSPAKSGADGLATFRHQLPTLPANAQRGAVPPAVQKRIEAIRRLVPDYPRAGEADRGLQHAYQAHILAAAKARLRSNDVEAAEEIIALSSPFEPGTTLWHFDNGSRLRALTDELLREGVQKPLPDVARRVLHHFDNAAQRAQQEGDKRSEAAARSNAAFLHERYLGDTASAIAAYRAALQAQPDDSMAQENLTRLETSLAILADRVRSRKN